MIDFQQFFETGELEFRNLDKVNKQFVPGSFGIEIEYIPDTLMDVIDEEEALEAYRDEQFDRPISPERWKDENPKPEKPEMFPDEDYQFDPVNDFNNYYKLKLTANVDFEIEELLNKFPDLKKCIREIYKLDEVFKGYYKFRNKIEFHNRVKLAQSFVQNIIYCLNYKGVESGELEKILLDYSHTWQKSVEEKVENINRKMFDELIQKIYQEDKEMYESDFAQWESDMEEYETEIDQWETDYDEIVEEYENSDISFKDFLEDYGHRFTKEVPVSIEDEVDYMISYIKDTCREPVSRTVEPCSTTKWCVFEDEKGIAEISSRILTKNDYPVLNQIVHEIIERGRFTSGTGCHVHIGMPQNTNAFDLLAMVNIVDEDYLINISGRDDPKIKTYAKLKENIFQAIYDNYYDDQIVTSNDLINFLHRRLDRYFGVNAIFAFLKYGTVEIRTLTSKILSQQNLIRIIDYFITLPHIAMTRQQFKFDLGDESLTLTRAFHSGVRINKDKLRVPRLNIPTHDTRLPQATPLTKPQIQDRLIQLQKNAAARSKKI